MDNKKQKLLIEYLISSSDTYALCQSIVDPEYFDPELRNAVHFIKQYYNEYSSTPEPEQVKAETDVDLERREVNRDQIEYCSNEIETFCKRQALVKAVLAAPKLIDKLDYGTVEKKIREAIMVSLHRDLGLRYFDSPEERLRRMLQENATEPTGWSEIDDLLFGGLTRKEMLLVSANSGGGKSITLANLGFNFMRRKRNVLYISLELSEDVIAQRYDTMFTGVSRRDWKQNVDLIATRISSEEENYGILDIVHMSSGTRAMEVRAYLKEYYLHYDMMPDLLVLDYIDKMNPNEKVDLSDVWTKDKLCCEQFRDIGVDYNMFTATASQLNRSAVGATHHDHSQIAGGISKINESDVYWSIKFTDSMRAAGEIAFILQKTRNSDGVGKSVQLKWDARHLRILDSDSGPSLQFKKAVQGKPTSDNPLLDMTTEKKGGLLDLMSV